MIDLPKKSPGFLTLSTALAAVLSVSVCAPKAKADAPSGPPAGPTLSDNELAPLTNFVASYKYEMKRPRLIYHWFDASDPYIASHGGATWTGKLSATDPIGYQYVQGLSSRYFNYNNPSDPGSGNMFGPGLYAALDPVATRSYGGGNDSWVLVQLRLPTGFTMLDLLRDGTNSAPMDGDVMAVLKKLGCPTGWNYTSGLLNNMLDPATHPAPSCTAAIEHILRDQLHIDGFLYGYNSTSFNDCNPPADPSNPNTNGTSGNGNPLRNGAFVITDSKRFKPGDIRVFNKNTTDDPEGRLKIQSSFYQADHDNGSNSGGNISIQAIYAAYPAYQGWNVTSTASICANSACTAYATTFTLCAPSSPTPMASATPGAANSIPTAAACVNVPAMPTQAPPAYPTRMSKTAPPFSGSSSANSCSGSTCTPSQLLWADMDGKQTDPALGDWMKKNLYGCAPQPDYLTAQEFGALTQTYCSQPGGHPADGLTDFLGQVGQTLQ
jgi:hypothetical protein